MSNLEPIEDADLDLKNKFIGDPEKTQTNPEVIGKETAPTVPEKKPEMRQEGMAEKEKAYTKILAKVKTAAAAHDDAVVADDAKDVSAVDGEEAKIETLIKLANTKGVEHAVRVARHWEDNYALDEFHDRLLADELHDALVEKGMLKEI